MGVVLCGVDDGTADSVGVVNGVVLVNGGVANVVSVGDAVADVADLVGIVAVGIEVVVEVRHLPPCRPILIDDVGVHFISSLSSSTLY